MRELPKRPEYDLVKIGNNLRRLRQAKGLSVEEVRQYLMIGTTQAIYKYENGKSYPQTDTLLALMALYGATIEEIIGGPVTVGCSYEEDLEGSSSVIYAIRPSSGHRAFTCVHLKVNATIEWGRSSSLLDYKAA